MRLTRATRRIGLAIAITAAAGPAAADEEAVITPSPLETPGEVSGPPSRSPQSWVAVSYGTIAASRTRGTNDLVPDDATKAKITSTGRRAAGSFRICFDDQGAITLVRAVKRTGFPAYDERIRRELGTWRFQPGLVSRSKAICTDVAIAYPPGKDERQVPPAAAPALAEVPDGPGAMPTLPPLPPPRRLRFLMRVGVDFGCAELVQLRASDGDTATLKAGQLAWYGAGILYQAAASWSLEATLGYKTDGRSGSTGSVHFSRVPLDLIASFAAHGHRLGAGLTVHFLPTFHCDAGVCGVSADIPLDTSLGFLAQWAYSIRRGNYSFDFGVRYTHLSYEGNGIDEFDGSSFGFFLGSWR